MNRKSQKALFSGLFFIAETIAKYGIKADKINPLYA